MMKFNLKFLIILSTSIIICGISNKGICMNRENTTDIMSAQEENTISWGKLTNIILSFQNNDNSLTDSQIKLIQQLSNEAYKKLLPSQQQSNLMQQNSNNYFDAMEPGIDKIYYNLTQYTHLLSRSKKDAYKDLKYGLLPHFSYNRLKLLQMHITGHSYDTPVFNTAYYNLIDKIKQCYKQGKINQDDCITLLQILLYYNTYDLFNKIHNKFATNNTQKSKTKLRGTQKKYEEQNYKFLNECLSKLTNKDYLNNNTLYTSNNNYSKQLNGNKNNEHNISNSRWLKESFAINSTKNRYYIELLQILDKIVDTLIFVYFNNEFPSDDIIKSTAYETILLPIIQGIYDNAYCVTYDERNHKVTNNPDKKYYDALIEDKYVIKKLDDEFGITSRINNYINSSNYINDSTVEIKRTHLMRL